MDFLIVLAMSILTPFYMSWSDVSYDSSFGVAVTQNSSESGLVNYDAQSVKSGTNDARVLATNFAGPNDATYDVILQFKAKTPWFNDRLYFGARSSWRPLKESVTIQFLPPTSIRPSTSQYYFYELPMYGLFTEYDLIKPDSYKMFRASVSPYIGVGFMRVAYAGSEDYEVASQYDSATKLFLGLNFKSLDGWNFFVDYSMNTVDLLAVDGSRQDFTVSVNRIQFGASYTFIDDNAKRRLKKDATYDQVIEAINPNIEKIIELEKQKQLEEELAKAAATEASTETVANEAQKLNEITGGTAAPTIRSSGGAPTFTPPPTQPLPSLPTENAPAGNDSDWKF